MAILKPNITSNGIDLDAIKLPKLKVLDPFDIEPLKGQIRKRFFGIAELAASIKTAGQATPIIVRELPPGGKYSHGLVDGERRLRACCDIKRGIVACIHDGLTDLADIHALSVAANFGRQKHDCMEIAKAIRRFRKKKMKFQGIAAIFGKSTAWVLQHYSLLRLNPIIQEWLVPGHDQLLPGANPIDTNNSSVKTGSRKTSSRLTFSIALQLVPLDQEKQLDVAKRIVGQKMSLVEARRLVMKNIRSSGLKTRMNTNPQAWRNTLISVVSGIKTRIATYNDMKGTEIKSLLGGLSNDQLQSLHKSLEEAGEEITQLAMGVKMEMSSIRRGR